ncbi:DUF2892 domain-containing protein [Marinobacter sp.]|uniref:YgaP family membrane protein n=1 Tax=Marinobacter sp. TaxID=50741 RepID=UPI00356B2C52
MTKNMGSADRVIRVIIGLVLLSLVFVGPQTPWGWIGIIPLVTAAIGVCPLYSIVGIKTCPTKRS